jgi:hypothetical protein
MLPVLWKGFAQKFGDGIPESLQVVRFAQIAICSQPPSPFNIRRIGFGRGDQNPDMAQVRVVTDLLNEGVAVHLGHHQV